MGAIQTVRKKIRHCQSCNLHRDCQSPVPTDGVPFVKWLIVGEAPGKKEDEVGKPFVGRAGNYLRRTLSSLNMHDIGFANVISCRPPSNRSPKPDEIAACASNLDLQIGILQPDVIIATGATAIHWFRYRDDENVGQIRGSPFWLKGGRIVVATWHPAYVLRSPMHQKEFKKDLRLAKAASYPTFPWPIDCVRCGGELEVYDRQGIPYCAWHRGQREVGEGAEQTEMEMEIDNQKGYDIG